MTQQPSIEFQGPCLEVNLPCLSVGGVDLAKPVLFSLKAGTLNVLRGGNGSGKSSLLKVMALYLNNSMPGQASVYSPDFALRTEWTVLEQLHAQLAVMGQSQLDVQALLERVHLWGWRHERVGTLSSGQRARLVLLVMSVSRARVWLLDEPQNTLDDQGAALLGEMLSQHLSQGGWVLLATHQGLGALQLTSNGLGLCTWQLSSQGLKAQRPEDAGLDHAPVPLAAHPSSACGLFHYIHREWRLLRADQPGLYWAALFLWMVLSFFGFALKQVEPSVVRVLMWVSLLLSLMLGAHQWFTEDQRVGWHRFLLHQQPSTSGLYWLARCLLWMGGLCLVLIPVCALAALQLGLDGLQCMTLLLAMACGVLAAVPLLGVLSMLVLMTRGGAVLVYLLGLPLLVPVLVFGLEASQAEELGRAPWPALMVLVLLGLLGLLTGPVVAKRLLALVEE